MCRLGIFVYAIFSTTLIHAAPCEDLTRLALPDVKIKFATPVIAGQTFAPPVADNVPPANVTVSTPFCRVEGTIEKEIEFELWLPPAEKWNGKFLGAGVGGDAGTFNLFDVSRGVTRGYAAASTDTGHKVSEPLWRLGEAIRMKNYEHRANHLLAEKAKIIIAAYYAKPLKVAYFIGCSGGGHQGLQEMQRYPEDYNGIISGAPGPQTNVMSTRRLWEINLYRRTRAIMSDNDWQMVSDTAAKVCDTKDGVADGVPEDPRSCSFDPAILQCKSDGQKIERKNCLNAEQIKAVKTIYAPLIDENGRKIDDGLLWGTRVIAAREAPLALSLFGQGIHKDANWDLNNFSVANDFDAITKLMPELPAVETKLNAFRDHGGKIIVYQGWMDPYVPPQLTISYSEAVQKSMGGATNDFYRLFMQPGVYHCRGGPGPDNVGGAGMESPIMDAEHDLLSALERWVEHGIAPEKIIASKVENGKIIRSRPLCVYPNTASYKAVGDIRSTDDAANFICKSN